MTTKNQGLLLAGAAVLAMVMMVACNKSPVSPGGDVLAPTNTPGPSFTPTVTEVNTKTASPTPSLTATPLVFYTFQDFESGINPIHSTYRATVTIVGAPVYQGSVAGKVVVPAAVPPDYGGTFRIDYLNGGTVDLFGAGRITLQVYDTQGNNTVQMRLVDSNGNTSPGAPWSDMAIQNQWRILSWDLSTLALGPVDITKITSVELYEYNGGIYYFDDVRYWK